MCGMAERPPSVPAPGASLRAQILATEHWGLLAARTTTQNEVLARIALLLTVLSAGLVTVGLLGQVSGFGTGLAAAAFGIDAFVWLVAVLTLLRVLNASADDAVLVLGMNRIRAAYVELDEGVERYFVESAHDDEQGLGRTYFFLGRSGASQALASSAVFTVLITAVLTGLLLATGVLALGGPVGAAVIAGALVTVATVAGSAAAAGLQVGRLLTRWTPMRPTPTDRTDATDD